MHGRLQELYWQSVFELFENCRVVLVILRFSGQLGELRDVMIDIASFHFQLVEFRGCFIVGVGVVLILDEVLFKLVPDIYVGGCRYWPPHNLIFYAPFPFGDRSSLYEGEGVRNLSIGVRHDRGVRIKELIEFEFVHELVSSCSISGKDSGLFSFQLSVSMWSGSRLGCGWLGWSSAASSATSSGRPKG